MPSRRVEGEETFAEETTKETGKAKETQYIYIYSYFFPGIELFSMGFHGIVSGYFMGFTLW